MFLNRRHTTVGLGLLAVIFLIAGCASTQSLPFWASTIERLMDKPIPMPEFSLVVKKGSKM